MSSFLHVHFNFWTSAGPLDPLRLRRKIYACRKAHTSYRMMIHNAYANWLYPCHHSLLHSTATRSACRMYTASVIAQAIKIVAASALDTTATYSPSRSATAAVEACSPTSIMCPWRRWHSDTALSRPKSLSCCRKSRP